MNSRPADLEKCMGPLWQPKLWNEINTQEYLKNTNCYSYAFNYIDYGEEKLQPGEIHGSKYKENTCDEIIQKMKNDYVNDSIIKTTFDESLPTERYKIALFIDPDKKRKNTNDHDQDYHFYRQDCLGTWSHKPGTNDATNEDASGNAIINPENADRNYERKCRGEGGEDCEEEHHYNKFCGYFSVPKNSVHGPVTRFIDNRSNDNDNNDNDNDNNDNNNNDNN